MTTKPATTDVVWSGALFGIGRAKSYELAQEEELVPGVPIIKVGRKFRVPVAALERVLGDLSEQLADYDDVTANELAIEPNND